MSQISVTGMTGRSVVSAVAIIGGLLAPAAPAQPVPPAGEEFIVNTYTLGRQWFPEASASPDGSFVVVWSDGSAKLNQDGQDGSDSGVQGQVFDSRARKFGAEFQVNTNSQGQQLSPIVRHDTQGRFLIAWADSNLGENRAQRFRAGGSRLGDEFEIAASVTGIWDLVFQPSGDFVAIFGAILGRRFEFDGTPIGDEFQVNTILPGIERDVAVSADAHGNFVVVWSGQRTNGYTAYDYDIQARRFDFQANPLGAEFVVNNHATLNQRVPDVVSDRQGNFLVVWYSNKSNGDDFLLHQIQAQRFGSDGSTIGGEFQVNTTTLSVEYEPEAAINLDGTFMVVWTSSTTSGDDTDGGGIAGQGFNSDGNFLGSEFQINTYTTGPQFSPKIVGEGFGRFVVVWVDASDGFYATENGRDGHLNGVLAQRYEPLAFFADGFESGDTAAWSSTQ